MSWVGIGIIGVVVAGVTVVLGGNIRQLNRLRAHGIRTLGTVTGQQKDDTQDGGIRYCLLVQFAARNGRRYSGRTEWHQGQPQHWVGDEVAIVYEAGNPYGFQLESELSSAKNYWLLLLTWVGAAYFFGTLNQLVSATSC